MSARQGTLTRDSLSADAEGAVLQPVLFRVLRGDRPTEPARRYALGRLARVTIGRGEDGESIEDDGLHISLEDSHMSSSHVVLEKALGAWTLRDAGSKNGTFIGAERVSERQLADGDVIEVGHAFFLYRTQLALPRDAPAACGCVDLPAAAAMLGTLDPDLVAELEGLGLVARSDSPVVLLGASGTGKELAARAVHELSGRAGAFVAVNCASLPEQLVEAELFGVRKNAFTGATEDRDGLVLAAAKGTLFLDEVGELPAAIQSKLLRVIEQRQVRAVGGVDEVDVDFRLIAATNRDLEADVREGRFRADLYNRVAGFVMVLPELRHRVCDLGTLTSALLLRVDPSRAAAVTIHYGALRALIAYSWPGNVRELARCLETALALAPDGAIEAKHLPRAIVQHSAEAGQPVGTERERFTSLLKVHQGNVAAVARAMGTSRTQVHRLARRLGIDFDGFRS